MWPEGSTCKPRSDLLYTRHLTSAQVAQLVEQRIENPRVAGSIPALGTTFSLEILLRFKELRRSLRQ